MKIRIGTRGSKLALWQAHHVRHLLESGGMEVSIREYKTEGDLITDRPLSVAGGMGLFTKVLDQALLDDEVDIAVHSSKDIPTAYDPQLRVVAFLQREDPRDVLLAVDEQVDFDNLSRKLIIGTSSPRRKAFVQHYLPHCEVKDIRGNVDTRVAKMQAGEYDGILLALAGVRRMGMEKLVVRKMNPHTFTPAPGQGAIAVMALDSFSGTEKLAAILNHPGTAAEVRAERAFLTALGGGCAKPIFALATATSNTLTLTAGVASADGATLIRENLDGPAAHPETLGQQLAEIIQNKGGKAILHG